MRFYNLCRNALKISTKATAVWLKIRKSFITNDLERTVQEIPDLYKAQWQTELFFKWIKKNLKIKRFLGRSENAVKIQVLPAMIAYLLLHLAQITTHCKIVAAINSKKNWP